MSLKLPVASTAGSQPLSSSIPRLDSKSEQLMASLRRGSGTLSPTAVHSGSANASGAVQPLESTRKQSQFFTYTASSIDQHQTQVETSLSYEPMSGPRSPGLSAVASTTMPSGFDSNSVHFVSDSDSVSGPPLAGHHEQPSHGHVQLLPSGARSDAPGKLRDFKPLALSKLLKRSESAEFLIRATPRSLEEESDSEFSSTGGSIDSDQEVSKSLAQPSTAAPSGVLARTASLFNPFLARLSEPAQHGTTGTSEHDSSRSAPAFTEHYQELKSPPSTSLPRSMSNPSPKRRRKRRQKKHMIVLWVSALVELCTQIYDWIVLEVKKRPKLLVLIKRGWICQQRLVFFCGCVYRIRLLWSFYHHHQIRWFWAMLALTLLPYVIASFALGLALYRWSRRSRFPVPRYLWLPAYFVVSPALIFLMDAYITFRYIMTEPVDSGRFGRIARYLVKLRLFTDSAITTVPQVVFQLVILIEAGKIDLLEFNFDLVVGSLLFSIIDFLVSFVIVYMEAREREMPLSHFLLALFLGGSGFLPYEDVLIKEEVEKLQMRRLRGLDDEDLAKLMTLAGSTTSLKKLDLQENNLGKRSPAGFRALTNSLFIVSTSITCVVLDFNRIDDAGAVQIAEQLRYNSCLKELSLNFNEIGDLGGSELGRVLRFNRTLAILRLKNNFIQNQGVKGLTEGLHGNHSLKLLSLANNALSDQGVQFLSEGLKDNRTLRILDLSHNRIGPDGAAALSDALAENYAGGLAELDLSRNRLGDAGASRLAQGLRTNQTVESLRLRSNRIGYQGASTIVATLGCNIKLRLLDLRKNDVPVEGRAELGLDMNESCQVLFD